MMMATTSSSSNAVSVSADLPEDIICEILKHCSGLAWSYRELALLCRINKEWARLAKRVLYREVRVDYRNEVDSLAAAFNHAPQAASLVRSIVINGDGAHAPNIYRLLRQANQTQHIYFFDFELTSALEEHTLCASIPLQNLTSLSFSVLPPDFVDKVLSTCSRNIKSLRMYRVMLAGMDIQPWRAGTPRWHLPKLLALSLKHVGNIPAPVFQELIANPSKQLRSLKIDYSDSYEICKNTSVWASCSFDALERLELGSFLSDVASGILANDGEPLSHLHTLRLPALRRASAATPSEEGTPDETAPTQESHLLRKQARSILDEIPKSVQVLEFQGCEDPSVCRQLPDHLERHLDWLPKLRICPPLTLASRHIDAQEMSVLRIAYFAAARKSGLRMPEGSQYYALKRHGTFMKAFMDSLSQDT
ncbi:hypothetical protein P389DRAFT_92436 [Cystobasidium minutum MCA 4210]|uniref:uncharacterized protein n=1 Tax=Cystobasidium minutum MCA 4210 TaxID=1397322 RepID=UPI0034CD1926|eukprot:jgi/Rhomi1/92436/CE92435_438